MLLLRQTQVFYFLTNTLKNLAKKYFYIYNYISNKMLVNPVKSAKS